MGHASTLRTTAIAPAAQGLAFDDIDREIAANLKAEASALVLATLERRIGGFVLDLAGDWAPPPLTPGEVERRRGRALRGEAPLAPGPALTPFPTIAGLCLGYRPNDGSSHLFVNPDDPRGAAQPAVRAILADLERQIDAAMRRCARDPLVLHPRLLTVEQVAALRLPPDAAPGAAPPRR